MVVGRLRTNTKKQGQRTQESGSSKEDDKIMEVALAKGATGELSPPKVGWSSPRSRSSVWGQSMFAGEERKRAGVTSVPSGELWRMRI